MSRIIQGILLAFCAIALAGCDPATTAQMQGEDVAKGREEILSGKHGKEAQQFAKEFEAMQRMSPAERRKRLRELEAQHGGN
jgi:hypothetical protein